jgi:hypothetical protein
MREKVNGLSIAKLSRIIERPQWEHPQLWRYGATVSTRPFQG